MGGLAEVLAITGVAGLAVASVAAVDAAVVVGVLVESAVSGGGMAVSTVAGMAAVEKSAVA